MTGHDNLPSGSIADLIATIGTSLTFTGTVTHASYLPALDHRRLNRRLVIEDHGVTVKTIASGAWAGDIAEGDTATIRGPIKGYEIEPRGLVIVLHRTRPLHLDRPEDPAAPTPPGWPPAPRGGVRQRFRARHDPLLRAGKTKPPRRTRGES